MMATNRSLKNLGRRGLSLFMAAVMTLSLIQISAFAAAPDYSDRVENPSPKYQYALAEGDNAEASEKNHDIKISKSAEATSTENEFKITLTVDSKDRIVSTEKIVGADIVLVFDLSSSMDGQNWTSLKSSANSFINKMLGADSSGENRISIVAYSRTYAMLQDWTGSAQTAKNSYKDYDSASALNRHLGVSSGTNCQAGFYAADAMLDSARPKALTYVVYMSDGEANSYYADLNCSREHDHKRSCYQITTDVERADAVFADNSYTTEGTEAAKLQAARLKNNHSDTKVITVGLGTGSNAVLDPKHTSKVTITEGYVELTCTNPRHKDRWDHDFSCYTWVPAVTQDVADGNTAVDEFHPSSTDSITSIYDSIATQIVLESNPWTVTDHMSNYVEFVEGSVKGSSNVSFKNGVLSWDLEADAAGSSKKSFTISYLVRLKDTDNTASSLWGYDENDQAIWHPTNGDTVLSYKVVKDGVTYPTRTVNFEVPQVRAETYTVTLRHVVDNQERAVQTFTRMGGYRIDLDEQIKNYGYGVQYTGRDSCDADGYVLTMNEETNGLVITYHYITGYQLTIHYLEQGTNTPVAAPYEKAYSTGAGYSVDSPAVDGYKLVNSKDATVTGTITNKDVVEHVYYAKEAYTVTYEFEGDAPAGVNPPTDNNSYDLFDHNQAVVLGVTEPTGWSFQGWTVDGATYQADDTLTITGNMTLVGTWEKISYGLDIVYQLDQRAYDAYRAELDAAQVEVNDVDEAEFTNKETGEIDEEAYNAAAEAAKTAAEEATEANVAAVNAKWAIGEAVDSYTANNGTTYTTDSDSGVYYFAREDDGTYHIDSTTTVNAIDVGDSFKVSPAANNITFTDGKDQTAFFAISNDLFSVTVVHHYVKGQTESTTTVGPVPYNNGEAYTVEELAKDGYEFDAENAGNDAVPGTEYTIEGEDVVVDLYYKAIPYTVTFTFEGEEGHGAAQPADQTKYVDEYAENPNVTAPDGWTFTGWYTKDGEETTPYDFNTPITGNVDLFGAWSRNEYKVTYHFVGEVPAGAAAPVDDAVYHYGDTAEDKTEAGYDTAFDSDSVDYSFNGWYTTSSIDGESEKYKFDTLITGNVELYGMFTADTAKYPYTIEYYLDGEKQGTLDSLTSVPFGSSVSVEAVEGRAGEAKNTLSEALGHTFITLDTSKTEGIASISAVESENVAKLYFTTNEYTLTINYWYYPNGSTEPAKVPESMISNNPYTETLKHGKSYRVDSPSLSHYYLSENSLRTVEGTIQGTDVSYDVYYLEHGKFTVTVEYYDIKDKGSETAENQIADARTLHTYNDATCDIPVDLTSAKHIDNYTYEETVGETSGIGSATTVYVYFSRDAYTVNVVHIDGAAGAPNQEMLTAQNSTVTFPVGDVFTHAPAATLPANYKQAGEPTITGATGEENTPVKGDTITVTYTYVPKGSASVTVNYVLVDGEGNKLKDLEGGKTTGYKEGDSYDVTGDISAFETANPQYTRREITGDTSGGPLSAGAHKTITVAYTLNDYSFTVEYYQDSISDGNKLTPPAEMVTSAKTPFGTVLNEETVGLYLENSGWLNAMRPSGYNRTAATYVTVGVDEAANVVTVLYTYVNESGGGSTTSYYYRVNTEYTGYGADGSVIYSDSVTGSVQSTGSSSYTLRSAASALRDGHRFQLTSATSQEANLRGTSRSDPYEFTVTYEFSEEDITQPENPGLDIPDEDVPMGELPDLTEDPGMEIPDGEVPLAEAPATGDQLMSWVLAAAVSGIGLVWLAIMGKKRKDEEA